MTDAAQHPCGLREFFRVAVDELDAESLLGLPSDQSLEFNDVLTGSEG